VHVLLCTDRHASAIAQAQKNILELNKSRLMALHELRTAKDRIAELGAVCGQMPAWTASIDLQCSRLQPVFAVCTDKKHEVI
jgi:hypothetical protein